MNKKSLFGLFALTTMLFTASCQEEDVVQQGQAGAEATVSINVTTPELGVSTRAFGDGTTAQTLHYAVYNVKGEGANRTRTYLPDLTVESHTFTLSTSVDLQLVTGNTYDVIFWADTDGNAPYSIDWANGAVTVDYSDVTSNNENYDAFFNWMTIEVTGAKTESIKLYRPFGQLNIGTSDIVEARKAGFTIAQTRVTVPTYNTLNLWTKEVSGETTATFQKAAIPTGEAFPVTGHEYLAMNYLLLPVDKELVEVTFDFYSTEDEPKNRVYSSVPLRRNWRTNIYGQLMTSDIDVNIDIEPLFEDQAVHPDSIYNIFVQEVATVEEFQAAIANEEVGGIVLSDDITLEGSLVFGAPATRAATNLPGRDIVIDGNGKTIKVVNYGTGRVIDFTSATNGADLTLKNLTIENNVSWIERIVNYNTNGTLTLENVKIVNAEGCSNNYAINLPASSDNATVVIKNCEIWAGANALNLWGEKIVANITNSKLYVVDSNAIEGYSVVSLNNQGENAAHYSTINVEGGEVKVIYEGEGETQPSSAFRDATVGSVINISETTVVVGEIKIPVVNVIYEGYDQFYSFTTIQAAIDKVQADNNGTIFLIKDLVLSEKINVKADDFNVVLNLNGYNMYMVDDTEAGFEMINNAGQLTIMGEGKLTVEATINSGWNRRSAVVSNVPGGTLTIKEGVVIEHLGGTDMAYGIDNLTNGKGTYAVTTIEGATIKSTYSAIRQFLNGTEATNELYVKAGSTLVSPNRSIFFQDPSKNPNTGKLVVEDGASVTGDVRLSVTEGSTEWPVEVSVAASALTEGSEVTSINVPEGYAVVLTEGYYIVTEANR